MMNRTMSFLDFWKSQRERGEVLRRTNELRLRPSHLKRLVGDSTVRAELHDVGLVSLLPPVGMEVFRCFTSASLEEQRQMKKNKEVEEKGPPGQPTHLEAEKPLPFIYGDPPPELLNTPLEELDPSHQSQTFIVLSNGNVVHRFDADSACFLLSPVSPVRKAAVRILTHSLFRLFVLLTIVTNCVFMTMSYSSASRIAEYVFIVVYLCEVIIKIMARGFCIGRFTFLRDPWNWLDVLVVSTAFLTPDVVDLGKLSVLRILPRALKMISVYPGVKMTAGALVQPLKRLAAVVVPMVFVLGLLALIGLQFFMGDLKHICVMWPINVTEYYSYACTVSYQDNDMWPVKTPFCFNFSRYISNETNQYFLPGHLDALRCGNISDAGACPEGFTCLKAHSNPNYGFTNYDSIHWSLLSVLRIMMQDYWEGLATQMFQAAGKPLVIIFLLLVFSASFFLFSVILALVAMALVEKDRAEVSEAKRREDEFNKIQEVMKRGEEEEEESSAAVTKSHEEQHSDVGGCPLCCLSFLKWTCCGCWQQQLHAFVTSPFFDFIIVICLVLNTLFMAMEHYPMTEEFEAHLSISNLVFTWIFTAEMILRLVALGPCGYFKVGWHRFDSVLVIISLLELGLADVEGLLGLRCFRTMWVLRLARWWPGLHLFIRIVWSAFSALRNLTLILLVTVFIFVVVGMQLFHEDYDRCVCRIALDCELPRWHMSDLFHTVILIFRVLCGEWVETMWDCMQVSSPGLCVTFFVVVVVVGHLLILNLFLSLLLSSVAGDRLSAPTEGHNSLSRGIDQIKGCAARARTWILDNVWTLFGLKKNRGNPDMGGEVDLGLTSVTSDQQGSEVNTPECEDEDEKQQDRDKGNTPEDCCCQNMSWGTGRVWSNFRRTCFTIVEHKYFEAFIIFIIFLSSAALVFEDIHLQQRTLLKMVLDQADQVFTCLFLVEMVLKWLAYGLKKYFTNVWCWIDFLILVVPLMTLTAYMLGHPLDQTLRSLMALRPLRALSRFQGLRTVLQTLVVSLPSLLDMLLVSLTVWLMFSVMGVNMFAGKFSYCFNETSEQIFLSEDVNNLTECYSLIDYNFTEVRWKNTRLNYDSVGAAYLSLVQVVTFSQWHDVTYAAADSTEVGNQPEYESNVYVYLYFILFIIIGGFFIFNFFIRVFIDTLDKLRHKFGGKHPWMTEEQRYLSRAMRRWFYTTRSPEPRPQNVCRALLFDLVTKQAFEVFMLVVICLNVLTLMIETDDQSEFKDMVLYWIHFIFILIFLTEVIVKLIALGRRFFSDSINILDFVLTLLSIVGMFLADLMERYFIAPTVFSVLRLVRLSRVLRLVRLSRVLPVVPWLVAFVMSFPALINICCLLLLLIFTFSIFGMLNFTYVKKDYMIDNWFNFETFGSSVMCLITMTTVTGWGGLLMPMLATPPDCDPDMGNPGFRVDGDCGSPILAAVFFTSYIVLAALLVVHMYIAVVMETFNMNDAESLSDSDLQMFYRTWKVFAPDASEVIQYSQLSDFCDTLEDPLKVSKPNTIRLIHMDLPLLPGDKIHWTDVLQALAAQVIGDSGQMDALKARMKEKFATNNSTKVAHEPISSTLQRKQEEVAATVIQRAFRKHTLQNRRAEPAGDASGGQGPSQQD